MVGYLIWCLTSCLFLGIGISCLFAKKTTGFWANSKVVEIKDVKKYNRAMCRLWVSFGIIMILLGLPLLDGQNSALVLISVGGVVLEIIISMIVYTFVIEKKYRKDKE